MKKRVLCELPNASALINGVAFEAHGGAMLSEEINEAVAAVFASIPGYRLFDQGTKAETPDAAQEEKPEPKRPRGRAAAKHED